MLDEPIRVLVADDNAEFREGLVGLLASAGGLEVVGQARDGDEAVRLAARLQPDVILMDLKMPGLNGIEATRRITGASPHIGILVLTMFDDDDSVFAAMRAGARGYLLKGALKAETLRAIRAVASGEAIFGPAIARRLSSLFAAPKPGPFPELTERERDILALLARGQSNPAIAAQLGLSAKTVANYVSTILAKLQVVDRAEAIIRARNAGFGRDGG
ncbi:MAG TPA: response regulator transcription factor [Thermomicrobiaceae bacterium]|nr:response regulator transcription factor [Thermomicrobiaceae bacterium]